MQFTVPEWPLYLMAWFIASIKFYDFWQSRGSHTSTNYIWLGKSFGWFVLGCVYLWASFQSDTSLVVRNFVRLAVLLLMALYLYFSLLSIYLARKIIK